MKTDKDTEYENLSFDGYGLNGSDQYKTRIATFSRHVPEWERLRLAMLLIAAPDMLDTLKMIDKFYDIPSDCSEPLQVILRVIRDTIAKAEGR